MVVAVVQARGRSREVDLVASCSLLLARPGTTGLKIGPGAYVCNFDPDSYSWYYSNLGVTIRIDTLSV
jgi:hypothetical protein